LINKQIAIDPWQKFSEPITVVQYEGGSRTIKIQLNSGGLPIDLTGTTVVFYARKPDDTILFNACTIIDAEKGLVEYTLTTQMCAVAGSLKCWIETIKTSAVLRTQEFQIEVQASEDSSGAVESTDEFTALEAALATVGEYDSRIESVETQADDNADAIATMLTMVNAIVPVGLVIDWPLPTLPSDYFIWARGQVVNRADYPALWAVVQAVAVDESVWSANRQFAYSVGDGSTTFRVPDRRGRGAVGYADGDTDFGTLGQTLGSKTGSFPLSSAGYAKIAIQNVSSNNILVDRITVPSYTTTHKLTGSSPGATGGTSTTFAATLGGSTDSGNIIQPTGVTNFAIRAK
jgi:microcystin-dependent protein